MFHDYILCLYHISRRTRQFNLSLQKYPLTHICTPEQKQIIKNKIKNPGGKRKKYTLYHFLSHFNLLIFLLQITLNLVGRLIWFRMNMSCLLVGLSDMECKGKLFFSVYIYRLFCTSPFSYCISLERQWIWVLPQGCLGCLELSDRDKFLKRFRLVSNCTM